MDNIAHTLVGAWLGEVRTGISSDDEKDLESRQKNRSLFWAVSILANNAPDFDLFLTPLLPAPLGYLLHHRGHTHTLAFAPLQILFVFGLLSIVPAFRQRWREDRAAVHGTVILAVLGLLVHLGLDALNSYGLHPFWPLQSRWYYGDLVFIVEPVLWLGFGVPVAMTLRSRGARIAIFGWLLGIPLAATMAGILLPISAAFLGIATSLIIALHRRYGGRYGFSSGFALVIIFLILQGVSKKLALEAVRDRANSETDRELDIVLTPLPSHPICWSYLRVGVDSRAATYSLERGLVSAVPNWFPTDRCPRRLTQPGERKIGHLKEIAERVSRDCWFDAWLRFARAPWLENHQAVDGRFSNRGRTNFTTLPLPNRLTERACPQGIPGWDRPRQDLLNFAGVARAFQEPSERDPHETEKSSHDP